MPVFAYTTQLDEEGAQDEYCLFREIFARMESRDPKFY
jgi:hypothetical protein